MYNVVEYQIICTNFESGRKRMQILFIFITLFSDIICLNKGSKSMIMLFRSSLVTSRAYLTLVYGQED